jgi:hypothetical protein
LDDDESEHEADGDDPAACAMREVKHSFSVACIEQSHELTPRWKRFDKDLFQFLKKNVRWK